MKDSPLPSSESNDSVLDRLATDELKKFYLFLKESGRNGVSLKTAMEKCSELGLQTQIIAVMVRKEILSFDAIDGVGSIRIMCKNIFSGQ